MRDKPNGNVSSEPTEAELASLPEHHRCVLLHARQGLMYEDIALMLGIKEGTVKSRINRAREKIAKMREAAHG